MKKLTPDDLQRIAMLFRELSLDKYRIVIIENGKEEEYMYDLLNPPEDGFDELMARTITASINNTLLNKEKVPLLSTTKNPKVIKKNPSPYFNKYLWEQYLKKVQ